jgi:GTPase SAR1 family protein
MAFIDEKTKEINIKVCYWGPACAGKTTNLTYIYKWLKEKKIEVGFLKKSQLLKKDEILLWHFDFLAKEQNIANKAIRINFCSLRGVNMYQETREITLKGLDAVVFVYDSQKAREDSNIERLWFLNGCLNKEGRSLSDIPYILQLNKRDLSEIYSATEIVSIIKNDLGYEHNSLIESIAIDGMGVIETYNEIYNLVINKFQDFDINYLKQSTKVVEFGFE